MTRIVAVGMVRNEADIIESFVRHTLQFVDQLYLIDHLSTDQTPQILASLQNEGLPLYVKPHSGQAFIQEILTTELGQKAFAAGADWVIPLDCDEFIEAPSKTHLRRHLSTVLKDGVGWWPWVSMVPFSTDDETIIDPARRVDHRCAHESFVTAKCILHRSLSTMKSWKLAPGNHHVCDEGMDCLPMVQMPEGYSLRHYPVRSVSQLILKMVLGRLAWIPRLEKGSNISFHTRDFFNRLKSGWIPSNHDLTAYACNYQESTQIKLPKLVKEPLKVGYDLKYTNGRDVGYLPKLLDWAEANVLTTAQKVPKALFLKRQSSTQFVKIVPVKRESVPDEAASAFNQANAAFRVAQFDLALNHLASTLKLMPNMPEAHVLQARALRSLGKDVEAKTAYNTAIKIDPTQFNALLERGNVLRALGDVELSAASYSAAMDVRNDDPRPALALARLMEEQSGVEARDRATVAVQRALDRASRAAEPELSMAGICRDLARFRLERSDLQGALESLRQARLLVGHSNLVAEIDLDQAQIFLRLGMSAEAESLMEGLSGTDDIDLLRALAQLSYRFNYWSEAIAVLSRCTQLLPGDAQAYLDLASMQVKAWLLDEALVSLDQAEGLGPVPAVASTALRASIANRLGDAETALCLYDGLVAEGHDTFASNAAMSLLYSDSVTPAQVARRHQALFADWGQDARSCASFTTNLDPNRSLRIGMVTGDLHHQHPVNIFLQPMLARWDHVRLPLIVYNIGNTTDDQTRIARRRARGWRDLSAVQLSSQVEADEIDLLIDLSGHTAGIIMHQFAKRMAPVQVSFLGYPGSTGVPNIDWLIGDPVVTPPELDKLCSEQVMRLPDTVFCFAPEAKYSLPDFAAIAATRPITFGSFNNIPKLTPSTVRLWARVLKAVPSARLLLRAPSFKDVAAVTRFQRLFESEGIEPARLIFRGPVGLDAMMQSYSEIDIALDPVPYCGGTTTLQALWMGVPVLTLSGGHFVSRMGASFMIAAGLPTWVVNTEDNFVARAVEATADLPALIDLKCGLRDHLLKCVAWDANRYTENFGNALREIWHKTMLKN